LDCIEPAPIGAILDLLLGAVDMQQASAEYRHLQVVPLSGALGAEVRGIDAGAPLGEAAVAELRRAFLAHQVIFLRDQKMSPPALLEFASRFGEPMAYPQLRGLPECPLVTPVVKLEHERHNFGGVWHTDTSYLDRPPMGSMLFALELPPHGGDTLFASQYLAYEALSDGLRGALAKLVGMNTSTKAEVTRSREDRLREAGVEHQALVGRHPVVRTHPETGRKSLYVNRGHTQRFEGWSEDESAPLLEYLFAHQIHPEFTCRFRWSPGSLAFWDNRCTLHYPINDYHGFRRVMHRVTITGDIPR
jgi:taurine dioxygenase